MVAASAQRVALLNSASSWSRCPRAWRSAANGEKSRLSDVRNSSTTCASRLAAEYVSTSPGGAYAASTHRSAQKRACASSADGARGAPNRSAARTRSRPAGSSPIPAAARRHIRHAATAANSHEASYDQTAALGPAAQRDGCDCDHDPRQGLADPVDPERLGHLFEPAGRAQVGVRDGGEGHRGRRDGDRVAVPAGERRERHQQEADHHAGRPGDQRAALDQAAQVRAVGGADADRHLAHGRQVHPEAAAGRRHEGDLDGNRDQAQPAGRQLAGEDELHAVCGDDTGGEPGNVQRRARQERAMVTDRRHGPGM